MGAHNERITMANSGTRQGTTKTRELPAERVVEPWERDAQDLADEPAARPEPVAGDAAHPTSYLQQLIDWCAEQVANQGEDNMAVSEDMVRRMLTADSPEEVLREEVPKSGKDFIGIPLLLVDWRINESDYEDGEGFPYYASLRVMVGNPPESRVINCGGIKVMAAIMRLVQLGEFRQFVKLTGKKNKAGRTPLNLVAAE
jgi:hypothetical protein